MIDENRFHNCVRESEQALLVLVSTEGAVENDEVTSQHENADLRKNKDCVNLLKVV